MTTFEDGDSVVHAVYGTGTVSLNQFSYADSGKVPVEWDETARASDCTRVLVANLEYERVVDALEAELEDDVDADDLADALDEVDVENREKWWTSLYPEGWFSNDDKERGSA